jgi:hypothetical protein
MLASGSSLFWQCECSARGKSRTFPPPRNAHDSARRIQANSRRPSCVELGQMNFEEDFCPWSQRHWTKDKNPRLADVSARATAFFARAIFIVPSKNHRSGNGKTGTSSHEDQTSTRICRHTTQNWLQVRFRSNMGSVWRCDNSAGKPGARLPAFEITPECYER